MSIYIYVIIGFFMFVIGTLFGSFFSLATYRIPRHQDILIKRSYCPNCKHNLGFFDLIPILSYIIGKGKCRYCKEKISIRYPIFELTNGIVFLIFFVIFKLSINLVIVCISYAVIFVLIGAYVMKTKMTEEEKKELNKNTKKGVYITEIVIAMIIFTLLLVSSFVISRNYGSKSIENIARSGAISVAIKNVESAKATDYESLTSYSLKVEENSISYDVNVEVIPFDEIDYTYEDIVKKINVSVKYNVEGNSYEYNLTGLKGKVMLNE